MLILLFVQFYYSIYYTYYIINIKVAMVEGEEEDITTHHNVIHQLLNMNQVVVLAVEDGAVGDMYPDAEEGKSYLI